MRAVWLVLVAGFRRQWRSWVLREVPPASLGRVAKLVAGRMPDPSSPVEALASFTLQRDYGVRLGTVITLPMAAASQRQAVFNALAGGPMLLSAADGRLPAGDDQIALGASTCAWSVPGSAPWSG